MPLRDVLLRAAVLTLWIAAPGLATTASLDYTATIQGTYSTFQANSTLCPSTSVDPALNPCVTQGLINMTVPLEWLPLEDGQYQFPEDLSVPLFQIQFLGFDFGDVTSITPNPNAPYVQVNANGSTSGQDFNDGTPMLPVSAFVNDHLGEPINGVKFVFSSSAPFDAPPLITFSLDASSDAAETQQDALSWQLDLTGSAIAAPVPEPAPVLLLGVSIVALMAAARVGGGRKSCWCVAGSQI